MNKKILITGAAGFIGFHLSRQLLEQGYSIVGIDNLNDYYDAGLKENRLAILKKYAGFIFYKENIANKEVINEIFDKEKIGVAVNLAAQAGVRYSIENPDAYLESNLIGFYNILEACRNYPVEHLLFASSSSVYGSQKKVPFCIEDKAEKPISFYAATKKSNELMAFAYSHLYGIKTTGLRFFTVYGPYGRPDMAYFSFAEKIYKNETIKIFNHGDMYRDFTYIDDIVYCICRMLFQPPESDDEGNFYKVYNIGNSSPEKLMYFIETLEQKLGKTAKKEYLPMQPGDVYQTYADITQLQEDFNFTPSTSLELGLERFAEWYLAYRKTLCD